MQLTSSVQEGTGGMEKSSRYMDWVGGSRPYWVTQSVNVHGHDLAAQRQQPDSSAHCLGAHRDQAVLQLGPDL